jgi:hypothetical protein
LKCCDHFLHSPFDRYPPNRPDRSALNPDWRTIRRKMSPD